VGEIIAFPGHSDIGVKKALAYFRESYAEAGLSNDEIDIAMIELEPIVRQFLVRKEFAFNLPGDFNEEQKKYIADTHNQCMQSAISYFSETLWLALCNIAGLIGRGAHGA
jgi:hypothetical protein